MFNLEQSIADWRRQMLAAGIKSPVPLEELECHLREDIQQQIRVGLTAQLAFDTAVQRIGQSDFLKKELAKVGGTRESRLRKIAVTIAVVNIVFGAFGIFVGFFDLVGAYDYFWRGARFSTEDTPFLKVNWCLACYNTFCGFIALVAAKGLFRRQRSGITLTITYAALTVLGVLANASLKFWEMHFFRGDVFTHGLSLLSLIILLLMCQRSGLKEQYV